GLRQVRVGPRTRKGWLPMANTVKVLHAVYGAIDGNGVPQAQDVTAVLQTVLNKTPNGIVTINNTNMGGDPADRVVKHFCAIVRQHLEAFDQEWVAAFACQEGQTIDFFSNTAHQDGRYKRFKLKLSLPGKDIKGEWLCRCDGSALAYQSYCATYGTPRV